MGVKDIWWKYHSVVTMLLATLLIYFSFDNFTDYLLGLLLFFLGMIQGNMHGRRKELGI